jgi:hypothetical protein
MTMKKKDDDEKRKPQTFPSSRLRAFAFKIKKATSFK